MRNIAKIRFHENMKNVESRMELEELAVQLVAR